MDTSKLFSFFENSLFTTRWAKFGLTDFDLSELQWAIIENPLAGPVISGAGGYRKLRFAPKGVGKSGAFRVIYVPNLKYGGVALTLIYAKNEIANITAAGKKVLVKQAAQFEKLLIARKGE